MYSSSHYIKIKGLEKASSEHYFELDWEKVEDKAFNWKLIKITNSKYEFEGKMRQTIKITFVDDTQEFFQFDISFNSVSRGLINSLIGYIDELKKSNIKYWKLIIDLSLYINKDWYKQMWIQINWVRPNWKYPIQEQKELIEAITNKKWEFLQNDYSKYDEILQKHILEINDFVSNSEFVEEVKNEKQEEVSIEDIPF